MSSAPAARRQLRTFPGLSAESFQHPEDRAATEKLKQLAGFDKLCAKVLECGLERALYLENIACNVRVTDGMFPRVNRLLCWAAQILDVPTPELYVVTDPVPNAYTNGHTRPFVCITTGLLDLMSDEELLAVIAHELGHIKAGHVLYTMMASNIGAVIEIVGQLTLGVGALAGQGVQLALFHWARRAELTADRAALLAVQNLDACIRVFMKLAAGTQKRFDEMSKEEFLKQIVSYNAADTSGLGKIYKVLFNMNRTHPPAILRAHEVELWSRDGFRNFVA